MAFILFVKCRRALSEDFSKLQRDWAKLDLTLYSQRKRASTRSFCGPKHLYNYKKRTIEKYHWLYIRFLRILVLKYVDVNKIKH